MSIDPFTGRNPSYCFVDFHDADEASRALEVLEGAPIRNRPVRIRPKTERKGLSRRLPTKTYDRGWRAKEASTENVDESSYVFDRWRRPDARDHWITPTEERRRVYVGGLPRIPNQDVVNEEMRNLFHEWHIQAVSKLVSPRDKSQQQIPGSHYYCFVDFPTAEEASEAIVKLDGKQTSHGSTYRISIATSKTDNKVKREQRELLRELSPTVAPAVKRDFDRDWRRRE